MYSELKSCQLVLKRWNDNLQIYMEFQGVSNIQHSAEKNEQS